LLPSLYRSMPLYSAYIHTHAHVYIHVNIHIFTWNMGFASIALSIDASVAFGDAALEGLLSVTLVILSICMYACIFYVCVCVTVYSFRWCSFGRAAECDLGDTLDLHVCMHACLCVCILVWMCVCSFWWRYVHIHTFTVLLHTNTYTCVFACMYVRNMHVHMQAICLYDTTMLASYAVWLTYIHANILHIHMHISYIYTCK
jgi:hypothetical protein